MSNLLRNAFLISFLFFILGIITIDRYGISWDEPEHFMRGQAYLRLLLTGKTSYEGLPKYEIQQARKDQRYHERSYYQHDSFSANVWFVQDAGHPPLNDILAALFNVIFYQKLGLAEDIQSYHLFNIFISSVLAGGVYLFAARSFGVWAGIFSAIFLGSYPLFWSESHFNIKDPAQTAFYMLALYFMWKTFSDLKSKYLIWSSIFAGLSLSVKFNILFMPFIVMPWLTLLILNKYKSTLKFLLQKNTILLAFSYPVIMFSILVLFWPYLWQDIIGNLLLVFGYYKELGTEENFNISTLSGWNSYAIKWIIYTSQPVSLIFLILGLGIALKNWNRHSNITVLWLMMFLIPILRVSFPNTTIYGGVRQIMEYIPAFALLSGIGADYLRKLIITFSKGSYQTFINVIVLMFLAIGMIYPLVRYHPNENVYFNQLTGGLSGAYNMKLPSAGNTYGNAYLQAINWLNKNAEYSARVALIQGTSLNIATLQLRPDIDFSNDYWSGMYRKGEYLIELTPYGLEKWYPYAWEYVEVFLEPVYEVKVDGIAIAKVWKNDLNHTKPQYRKYQLQYQGEIKIIRSQNELILELERQTLLTRLALSYNPNKCTLDTAILFTSPDGKLFTQEVEKLPANQVTVLDKQENYTYFFFPARNVRFLKIKGQLQDSCFVKNLAVELMELVIE